MPSSTTKPTPAFTWIWIRGPGDIVQLGERYTTVPTAVVQVAITRDAATAERWAGELLAGRTP